MKKNKKQSLHEWFVQEQARQVAWVLSTGGFVSPDGRWAAWILTPQPH